MKNRIYFVKEQGERDRQTVYLGLYYVSICVVYVCIAYAFVCKERNCEQRQKETIPSLEWKEEEEETEF